MTKDFEKALKFVLEKEGFISNDKDDPGKLTIWGISSKYNPTEVAEMKWLIDHGKQKEAFQICKKTYKEKYWDRLNCGILPFPFCLVVFDCAINPGQGAAKRFLDEASGWEDFLLRRIEYYSDKNNKKYIRGWIKRTIDIYKRIKNLD